MPDSCLLGIDIGTTSVKVCVIDESSKEVLGSQKKDTCSDVPSELGKPITLLTRTDLLVFSN